MAGCSSSGLRPNGCVPASAFTNGLEPASNTMRAANTPPTMQSTITAPPVSRSHLVEVEQRDHHGDDGDEQQPQQERALLPRPEPGDPVEGREARVGVLGHVGEAEVLLEEGLQQHRAGDHRREEERVHRVVAVAQQVLAVPAHAESEEENARHGEDEREGEREAAEGRSQARPHCPVWAAGDAEPLYLLGHLVWSSSAVITPSAAAYLPTTTTSTPSVERVGHLPAVGHLDGVGLAGEVLDGEVHAGMRRD